MALKDAIATVQERLAKEGLYTAKVDGLWGKGSRTGLQMAADRGIEKRMTDGCFDLPYSNCVSLAFVDKVRLMAANLKMPEDGAGWFMGGMAFESGGTFSPTIRNAAGAPYYGIIQFGDAAAKDAGTSIPALLKMTAEQQLDYVYNFFRPYAGKLNNLSDFYMRILWPAAVGKPENTPLWSQGSKAYLQNRGLDVNGDGQILKSEAAAKVRDKYFAGLEPSVRRLL